MANTVNLYFDVSKQAITRTDTETVASGAINTLVANFDFCETWEGLYKFCRFEGAGGVLDVAIEDDKCVIPWEVIEAPSFTMACYGTRSTDVQLTTTKLAIKVYQSVNFITDEPLPPTPQLIDIYNHLAQNDLSDLATQTQVSAEATARTNADATLQGNINSEASTRAAADSELGARIDNIIAPSGDPSLTELADIRVGYNGATYPTAGDAVRGQVTQLSSEVDDLKRAAKTKYLPFENHGFIDVDGGGLYESENGRATDYVNVRLYDAIMVRTFISAGGYALAMYDANKSLIANLSVVGNSTWQNIEIDLTNSAYSQVVYVRASVVGSQRFDEASMLVSVNDSIADDVERKANVSDIFAVNAEFTVHGYVDVDGGGIYASENGRATNFVSVDGYDTVTAHVYISSGAYALAMYDANKSLLSAVSVIGNAAWQDLDIDLTESAYSNVAYVRASVYGSQRFNEARLAVFKKSAIAPRLDKVEEKLASVEEDLASIVGRHYGTFSVIGDSYSSFDGYMADSEAATWYPASNHGMDDTNDVENVEQTWWYKFANNYGSRLIENDSWSGSAISYDGYGEGTDDGKATSLVTRRNKLTTPELILVFGGTNDAWVANDSGTTATFLGDYVYSGWTETQLEKFRPALAYLLHNLKREHIGAKIVFMLNTGISSIEPSVDAICEHYGVSVLKLHDIAKAHSHPTEAGMTAIANQLTAFLKAGN